VLVAGRLRRFNQGDDGTRRSVPRGTVSQAETASHITAHNHKSTRELVLE
jgi:hypothetical protein